MSFLEAMARGQCVIAADNPTMNEYITHGVNGLLFAPRQPMPLDLAAMPRLGRRAREGIEDGFERWQRDRRGRLLDYIAAPPGADTALLREAALAMIA
jgi:glycosyltransferase involved in cell wall biosynthesis